MARAIKVKTKADFHITNFHLKKKKKIHLATFRHFKSHNFIQITCKSRDSGRRNDIRVNHSFKRNSHRKNLC